MSSDFEIKKVGLDNLGRFKEIYKLCLDIDVDESYFKWKYIDNPAGEVIAFEALQNSDIAGFYGVIPEKYLVDQEVVTVYQSMDTMTHPSYQKRGLFTRLAKQTFEYMESNLPGVHLIGIPGITSYHGFVNKLNWRNIHSFNYIFLHKSQNVVKQIFRFKSSLLFTEISELDTDFEALLAKQRDSNKGVAPYLTRDVIKWKVLNHPFKKNHIVKIIDKNAPVGYCIFSFDSKGYLKIETLWVSEDQTAGKIVGHLCSYLLTKYNCDIIYTWQPMQASLYEEYKKAGFIRNPFSKGPFSYKIPLIVYSNNPVINNRDWFNAKDFNLQPGFQD